MDSYIQNGALGLADSLLFKVQPAGTYVTDRRSLTLFSQGGHQHTPNGVRDIHIHIDVGSWQGPSIVKLVLLKRIQHQSPALVVTRTITLEP